MTDSSNENTKNPIHEGPDYSSPYPVSRLAPSFGLVDLATEIEKADQLVNTRVSAKLKTIAGQVKMLQEEAKKILSEAHEDQMLNHAKCNFSKIPGKVYHLYRDRRGQLNFSMLSPSDWHGRSPQEFVGSYRLELDGSWKNMATEDKAEETEAILSRLLGDQ